ncbi:MAG: hypothetical protein JST68_10550 [Bacteroidetes bacterium]|nr:hypothetical protein [Bacteroidota bacterium]
MEGREGEEEYINQEQTDEYNADAYAELKSFLDKNKEKVFYGRQLEVIHENKYFHWVTNRALRLLVAEGYILSEKRALKWGGTITIYWHKSFRYFKREAAKLIKIVEEYSDDSITSELGYHGELLVNEAFSRFQYLTRGRNLNQFKEKKWPDSNHNLDFVFEKDNISYGIEVKNTLGYIDKEEFHLKIRLCHYLDIIPVFVVRMLPKNWIIDLIKAGGYALLLKYQLYPPYFKSLAKKAREELELPIDSPRTLLDGTIQRFDNWHKKHVN